MSFGITNQGFVLKRLADILQDMVSALSSVQDPITGETLTVDLDDENDPLVQHVNAVADQLSVCWEQLQLAYNQFDPLKATGAGLSGLVQLNSLRRRAGTKSTVTLTLTGTPGTVLAGGQQVSTMDGTPIFVISATTIPVGGSVSVSAICTEYGPFEAAAGTLVNILTPVSGWASVTNAADATPGTYEETDTELRLRQQSSTSASAQTIIEAVAAGIANLESVEFVRVYQNITLSTDSRGIPAKSIAPVVVGGADASIAEVMYNKIAAGGCDTFGTTEEIITDSLGIDYPMRFTRPTEIPIYIEVTVTVINDAIWPVDGDALIIAAILSWVENGGSSFGTSSFNQLGFYPGRSVYASEFQVPTYTVLGMKVDSIVVGISPSPAAAQVIIDWDEIATFSGANITVTVN